MKKSHLFLCLFLIVWACIFGYLLIWVFVKTLSPLLIIYIPLFILNVIAPIFISISLIVEDVLKMIRKES